MANTKLILYFIKGEKSFFHFIRILNILYIIDSDSLEIDIDDTIFGESKEKKIIDVELIPNDPLEKGNKFKMNLFYGMNKAYCFLSERDKILIEYNFIEYENIFYEGKELNQFDGNGLVKRIILINAPRTITIKHRLIGFIFKVQDLFLQGENSFEICECDYTRDDFAVKIIKEEEKFISFNKVREQKEELNKFYNELNNLIIKKSLNKEEYTKIVSKFKINNYEINFCQPKAVLNREFKNVEDFYLMYLYYLWFSIKATIMNEEIKISIMDLFKEITSLYNSYLNDKDLLIYEKILLFCSNVAFFIKKNDIEKYNSSHLKYVIKRKDIKEGSTMIRIGTLIFGKRN